MIKTFEEWIFNAAGNVDLPAIDVENLTKRFNTKNSEETTKTLIFDKDDEFEYPNVIDDNTHGFTSHAIKHMWEFQPKFYAGLISKTKDILMHYIDDDMKIIDIDGRIEYDINDDEDIEDMSKYSIINALDFINDKTYEKSKLSDVEVKILELVIRPLRVEYKKLIDYIFNNAVRVQDYRKDMGNVPVYFNGDQTGRYINYYDPNLKGFMATSGDKNIVYTLFKINRDNIYDYFNKLNPGSSKRKPSPEIMGFLLNYKK